MQRSSDLKKNHFYSKYKVELVFTASSEGLKDAFHYVSQSFSLTK